MEKLFNLEHDLRVLDLELLDYWLPEDDLTKHEGKAANQMSDDLLFSTTLPPSTSAARGEVARRLLEDLEQIPTEEDLYKWCEENIDLSICDNVLTDMDLDLGPRLDHGEIVATPKVDRTLKLGSNAVNLSGEDFPQTAVKGEITVVAIVKPEVATCDIKEEPDPLSTENLIMELEHAKEVADKIKTSATPRECPSSDVRLPLTPANTVLTQVLTDGKANLLVKKEDAELVSEKVKAVLLPIKTTYIDSRQPEHILPDVEPVCVSPVENNSPENTDHSIKSDYGSSYPVLVSTSDYIQCASPALSLSPQPASSPGSSSSSVFGAPSPGLSSTCNESDMEWLPANDADTSQMHQKTTCSQQSQSRSSVHKKQVRGQNANKVLEMKLRKKEQNKSAATRYRMKKKSETEEMNKQIQDQMKKNRELHLKVSSIVQEIKYLKGLMREVFKAKGILKETSCST